MIMKIGEQLKDDYGAATLVLIPVAIVINTSPETLVSRCIPPLFVDSIRTVLVGLPAGTWSVQ